MESTKDGRVGLEQRVVATLQLFARWGHATTPEQLAACLLGGSVHPELLRSRLPTIDGVVVNDGLVCPEGFEDLLPETDRRRRAHGELAATYVAVARAFTADLVGSCPFVESVALAGSLATGGFEEGDDVDFDLFVRNGTRYTCYLLAILVGLKYAWRYRHREVDASHRTPFLPKITCVNVVWTEEHTDPFLRRDSGLAFELLRCRPLYGADRFREVLDRNPWLREYFPQLYEPAPDDEVEARPNDLHRFLTALGRHPRLLALLEGLSRGVTWLLYHFVQATRRRDPAARARMRFLQRVKWPYEVFQD